MQTEFNFENPLWVYHPIDGEQVGSWYFVTVPEPLSKHIRETFSIIERPFATLPVQIQVKNSIWKSSLFFDTKLNCYILPIKAAIRKKEALLVNDRLSVSITMVL